MNILIVTGGFPSFIDAKEAADVVQYSISKILVSEKHNVDLQIINYKNFFEKSSETPKDIKNLYGKIFKPILINYPTKFERFFELFTFNVFNIRKFKENI